MGRKRLGIGRVVFWNGEHYEIVGRTGKKWFLFNPKIHSSTARIVDESQISLLAAEEFKIGQKVQSCYGSFVGEVTAIEQSTNRVICVSLHPNSNGTHDRRRYAYLPNELEHYHDEGCFF